MQVNNLISNITTSNCNKCSILANDRNKIVVAKGNPNADVVIVGQAPGVDEDNQGIPFVGVAGRLLHSIIEDAGYNPLKDFFFTNVTFCHRANNVVPDNEHIQNCSNYFMQLTSSFSKIITIGKVAAVGTAITWRKDIVNKLLMTPMKHILTKGIPHVLDSGKVMYSTYHTSYLLRSGIDSNCYDTKLYKDVKNEIIAAKGEDVDIELSASLF